VALRAGAHLTSLGAVPDLSQVYSQARVFVAPTRFAAGIPLKVIEAAARGLPSVVTPLLAEQLGWRHEGEVLVAATPEAFADQCMRLHEDEALWERLREGALRRVARDFDPALFDQFAAGLLRQMQ
jgi:glycosyltransferase involved in cell wall biosynthesis